MSRILITIFTLFVNSLQITFAQQNMHYIDVSVDQPMYGLDFACAEIIDKREQKNHIGIVHKGRSNRPVEATFQKGFPLAMKFTMANLLPRTKSKEAFVFIFHEFAVKEIIDPSNDTGIATVRLEVAKRMDSTLVSLGLFESSFTSVSFDVTKSHGFGLYMALRDCIYDFNLTNWERNDGVPKATNALKLTPIYYRDFNPEEGIYYNFEALQENDSHLNNYDMKIDETGKRVVHYCLYDGEKRIKTKVKFIVKGRYIYIGSSLYSFASHRPNNSFVRAKNRGRYVYFEDQNANGRPSAAIAGGLLGAAMTSGVFGFVLDTKEGYIYKVNSRMIRALLEDHPEILNAYKQTNRLLSDRKDAIMALNKTFELK